MLVCLHWVLFLSFSFQRFYASRKYRIFLALFILFLFYIILVSNEFKWKSWLIWIHIDDTNLFGIEAYLLLVQETNMGSRAFYLPKAIHPTRASQEYLKEAWPCHQSASKHLRWNRTDLPWKESCRYSYQTWETIVSVLGLYCLKYYPFF